MLQSLISTAVNHFNTVNNCNLPTDEICSVAQYCLNQGKTNYLAIYLDMDETLDSDERFYDSVSHEALLQELSTTNYTMLATIICNNVTVDIFTY